MPNAPEIRISSRTDGNGKTNEDSLIAIRQDQRAILCVADGVGGLDDGDIASRYITKTLESWAQDKDVNQMGEKTTHRELQSLVANLHEDLRAIAKEKYGDESQQSLASTFVFAVVGLKKAVIECVGDSRAYVYQLGNCTQVTVDQTAFMYDLVSGYNYDILPDLLAKVFEKKTDREKDRLVMQSIGYGDRIPQPVRYTVPIVGNVDILLCSDGLSNTIREYEIKRELEKQQSGTQVLKNLIHLAKSRGETDNITGVLYRRRIG